MFLTSTYPDNQKDWSALGDLMSLKIAIHFNPEAGSIYQEIV